MPALTWALARSSIASRRLGAVDVAGVVGPDRLRPGDDLGDRRHHLAVALAGLLVRPHEAPLHEAQHERQRGGDRERDECQHPVVGEHDAGDEEHQRSVEQPGEAAPREELRQGLDVARDPGDERAAPLLVVVGEAEPVDVPDQPGAQVEQRLLAAGAEADDRLPLGDAGDDQRAGRDEREHADEADANAAVGADALVDRLLEQDRHHDAARRPDGGEQPGDPEPLAQDRRLLEPAADRADRGEAPERLGHSPPPRPTGADDRRGILAVGLERLDQLAVGRAAVHQLLVRAVVDDGAPFEVDHVVGQRDRRRPRRDHQDGGAGERVAQVAEHDPFGLRVERGRRVVEQQQLRPADQRPGQRDALALAAAEADAALADDRVEALAQLGDEAVGAGQPQRRPDLVVGRPAAEVDVLADRAGEQERLLEHHRAGPRLRWPRCRESGPIRPPVSSTSVLLPEPVGPTTATMRPVGHRRRRHR